MSGTFKVSILVFGEHVVGSPTEITLASMTPKLSKTIIEGDGLNAGTAGVISRFFLTFLDEHNNPAHPGRNLKFGLALQQGRGYKDLVSMDYTFTAVDAKACRYSVEFVPQKDGVFDLHIFADDSDRQGEKNERVPFEGSPFHCTIAAGEASADMSHVDGWLKETVVHKDKHGKAVSQEPDTIVAGDTVMLRPQICDAIGNLTILPEGALSIKLVYPDGSTAEWPEKAVKTATKELARDKTAAQPAAATMVVDGTAERLDAAATAALSGAHPIKLSTTVKGGTTIYEVRHDATHAGAHEVHLALRGEPIRGSPVIFDVVAAAADVKSAKLFAPTESPLYSNHTYAVILHTYDRFNNRVLHGGLAVAGRLQLIKKDVNDLTTIMPNNHTIEVEDLDDGTYRINVTLLKIAANVKVIVNMDKNIPANGGDLPAVTCQFVQREPRSAKELSEATGMDKEQQLQSAVADAPVAAEDVTPSHAKLREAGEEVRAMLRAATDGMRPKAAMVVAVEAFTEQGITSKKAGATKPSATETGEA